MGMDFTAYFAHGFQEKNQINLVEELNEISEKQFPFINEFIKDLLKYNPEDKEMQWNLI
ncbi:hypothetical protein [Paenibacillus bovis]|uniref:hypothetical protein n=1 Tax=Paenibacillus bovis TaxID=1616788 RepID=UPI000B0B948B|nr:hypothetical protein [Paenibacillus bovis]